MPLLALLLLSLLVVACRAGSGSRGPGARVERVAGGLEEPVAMAFAPDGSLFFNERRGRVRLITADGKLLEEPVLTLDVSYAGEWGLLGLALDPGFEDNGYLFVLYTEPAQEGVARPRINRYTVVDGKAREEVAIARLAETRPPFQIHLGGNMRFGPDGRLYVTVGDYGRDPLLAQNLSVPIGKVLRLNPDGSVPPNNPFDPDDGADPRVWAYGLRNSWDLDFDGGGNLWASGNGPDRCDQVSLIARGGDYGWPDIPEGTCRPAKGLAPKHIFSIDERPGYEPGSTVGPTGIVAYSGAQNPAWTGDLFTCAVNTGDMTRLDTGGPMGQDILGADVVVEGQCFLDVEESPEGDLYFSDFEAIYRLSVGE